MRMTSNRELARQLGVSETAVRRAETAGRIKREAAGSWDVAKVKAAWAINTDQAQQRPARSGRPTGHRRALKPVPEAAVGAVRDTLREHGEPVSAGGVTFMQARTANEVLKAQERRLRLQQMKGELVDRAKAVVGRLAEEVEALEEHILVPPLDDSEVARIYGLSGVSCRSCAWWWHRLLRSARCSSMSICRASILPSGPITETSLTT
jgi:hypothetical protein